MNELMYRRIVTSPHDIPSDYLRAVLHLDNRQTVQNIHITDTRASTTSLTIRLLARIEDEAGVTTSFPLFLKTVPDQRENPYSDFSLREVLFYKNLVKHTQLPVVTCWDAQVLENDAGFLLLLDDVSADYCAASQLVLTEPEPWFAAAKSLARFHAHFWNLQSGCDYLLPLEETGSVQARIRSLREAYDQFMAYVGERLDSEVVLAYERALQMLETLERTRYQRRAECYNITLIHGDSHIHNFMFPNRNEGLPLLVDFQFWGVGIGAGDVAHLTRCSFPQPFRASLHMPVLQTYYQALLANGVNGYSWDECLDDYFSAVASMLFIPVWQYVAFHLEYSDWIDGVTSAVESFEAMLRIKSENPE